MVKGYRFFYIRRKKISRKNEDSHSGMRITQFKIWLISFLTLLFPLNTVFANPQGGNLVAGRASISSPNSSTLEIHQASQKAILNWQRFNIKKNELVRFIQPSSGIALNRINPAMGVTQIYGRLTANGKIILINQAGIYFGASSKIDVGGLIASTSNISNANFLAGRFIFDEPSRYSGSIINEGQIIAKNNGLVALIGTNVRNDGYIQANLGSVVLASGNKFTFDFTGDQLINFSIDEEISQTAKDKNGQRFTEGVSNRGKIIANGGRILVSAKVAQGVLNNVINMKGVAQARSVYKHNGEIILSGNTSGIVRVSGKVDVSGKKLSERGGKVKILGRAVVIEKNAEIDASGESGGGEILIGGNIQGKGPLPHSEYAFIDRYASLNANAINKGSGGKIVVWSDRLTEIYGSLSSRGGALGGDGGFIETSSKQDLQVGDAIVRADAPFGKAGVWLLDPHNITIATTGGSAYSSGTNNLFSNTPSTNVIITPASINASTANVLLQANNDILINGSIAITTAGVSFTAQAGRSIVLNSSTISVATNNADINLTANDTVANGVVDANRDAGSAVITMPGTSSLSSGGGNINLLVNTGAGLTNNTSGSITVGVINAGTGNVLVRNSGPTAGSGIIRSGASNLITANSATLDVNGAGGGGSIGATGAPIRTTVTNFNARSQANVFIAPTGAVNLGSATLGGISGVTAPTTLSILTSGAGAITQSQPISTGSLILTNTGGSVTFNNTSNVITALGAISRGGDFTLYNSTGLTTAALTSGTTASDIIIDTSYGSGGSLTIGGSMTSSTAHAISLKGNGIIQNAGTTITTGTSSLTLNANANAINLNTGAITSTSTAASAINIQNATTIALGALTNTQTAATHTISGSGNITQNSALSLAGTVTFNTSGDIDLPTSTNNFGTVAVTNANNVTLRDSNRINLGTSTILGNLTVTAGATTNVAIGQVGALTVTGTPTFTVTAASSDVLLSMANQFATTPVFSASGAGVYRDLTLRNAAVTASVPTLPTVRNLNLTFDNAGIEIPNLTATTLTGTLSVTAGGNITQASGGIVTGTVTTTLSASGHDILLNDANNNFSTVSITAANNATLKDSNAINIGATTITDSFDLNSGGNVVFNGTTSVGDTLTLVASGTVTDSAAITADTLDVTSGTGTTLDFGHNIANFEVANLTSGVITFVNTHPDLIIHGVSQAATGTTVSLTNTGDMTIASGASVNSGTSLTVSTSGDLTVSSNATLQGGSSLTMTTSGGDFSIGTGANLSSTGATNLNASIGALSIASTGAVNAGTTLGLTIADLNLLGSLSANNGSSVLTITQSVAGNTLGLADASANLAIDKTELQKMTASALTLVAATNGQILINNLNGTTDMPNIPGTLTLTSTAGAGGITFQGSSSTSRAGITASTSGTFAVSNNVTASTGNNTGFSITAQDINLNTSGAISSGTGNTTLTQNTASGTIGVGSATGTMSISQTELQHITAGTFSIVAPSNGQILVDHIAATDLAHITTTQLTATNGAGSIKFQGNSSTFGTLTANTTGTLTVNNGITLATNNATLALTAADLNLNSTGALNSGTATTTITKNATLGTAPDNGIIELGNPSGTAFRMGISGNELQRMSAGNLAFVASSNGQILVNGVTSTDFNNISGNLTLTATAGTTGTITFENNPSSFKTLTATADGNISVNQNLTTTSGDITLTAGGAATSGVAVNVANGVLVQSSSNIDITANDLILNTTGRLESAAGTLTIVQNKTGGTIAAGDAVSGDLTINGTELQNITANILNLTSASNSHIFLGGISSTQSANINRLTLTATAGTTSSASVDNDAVSVKALTVNAEGGFTINKNLETTAGTLILTAGLGTTTGIAVTVADGATVLSNDNAFNITANDLNLNTTGQLNSGSGTLTITQNKTGGSIAFGDAVSGDMNISGGELQNISANNLTLTSATNSQILIGGISSLQSANINNLQLTATAGTTSSVLFENSPVFFKNISVNADGGITINSDITTTVGNIALTLTGSNGPISIGSGATITTSNANLTMNASSLTLDGHINAGTGNVSIATNNSITLGNATGGLSLSNAALQNILAASFSLQGVGITADGVTGMTSDAVTFTSTGAGVIRFQNNESIFNALTATSANGITVSAPLTTLAGNLSLDSNAGGLSIASDITSFGSLTLSGSSGINFGNSQVTLVGDGITFSNSITSGTDLALNSGDLGDITFNGNVTLSGALNIVNTYDLINNGLMSVGTYTQSSGNVTSFNNGITTTGFASITADTADGIVHVGSLTLDLNFANLTGSVNGLTGIDGAREITLAHVISAGTQFFDGIDLASLQPSPTPPIPPTPQPINIETVPQIAFGFLYAPSVLTPNFDVTLTFNTAALLEELDSGEKSCVDLGSNIKICSNHPEGLK